MKIEIGEFEVYENGSLILIENKPLKFSFDNSLFSEIFIVFSDQEFKQGFEFAKVDETKPKKLTLNIPLQINKGIPEYLQVGVVNNKELLFNFTITELDYKNKLFHYVFLLGKQSNLKY